MGLTNEQIAAQAFQGQQTEATTPEGDADAARADIAAGLILRIEEVIDHPALQLLGPEYSSCWHFF